jgi:hypothetical protein
MMFIYVIAVYVSSDPGTYIVRIRFTFQNRVWQWLDGKFPTGRKITVTGVRMTGIWVWLVLGGQDNMMDE